MPSSGRGNGFMNKILATAALIAGALWTGLAAASDETRDMAVFRGFLDAQSADRVSPDQRTQLVDDMFAYWSSFNQRVPRLSPADTTWVENEMQTTDHGRVRRILSSPQYALRSVVHHVELCLDLLNKLRPAIGGNKATELYMWLKVSQCYTDTDLPIYLRRANLSNGEVDGEFKMQSVSIARKGISGSVANSIINE
jgi:hypothetical protein